MNVPGKVLVIAGAGIAGVIGGAYLWRTLRARSSRDAGATPEVAGSMMVGAVDEVELGAGLARPMRGELEPEMFDPEEVPSEHPEVNELRNKMPFG